MGLSTYSTLFGLRYRLLLVYPLRMQHNSLPVGVQTLATYMLALLNPLCLWFTRIVVDPTALIASEAAAAAGTSLGLFSSIICRVMSLVPALEPSF